MIDIFLGPAGSGKGTQAALLCEKYELRHLSTGDLIRESIRNKTRLGLEIKDIVSRGDLISDNIMGGLVSEFLHDSNNQDVHIILDGFPRTLNQAQLLAEIIQQSSHTLRAVYYFAISLEETIERISGRLVCPSCSKVFHKKFHSSPYCDYCSAVLETRPDDTKEKVRYRFNIYQEQTEPLKNFYKDKLIEIDASKTQEEVFSCLEQLVSNEDN